MLAVAALLSAVTGHRICDLVFDCGCTWVFAGADAACDVHQAGPPDCPPCSNLAIGAASALGLFAAWTLLVGMASAALTSRSRTG